MGMEAIESNLAKYNYTTPVNVADALIVAARYDYIHLDCVYFLMRRDPNLIVTLLQNTSNIIVDDNNSRSNIVIHNDITYQQDDDGYNHDVDGNTNTSSDNGGLNVEHNESIDDTKKWTNRKRK